MSALAGKRVLLVEDEFIVAAMAADMLQEVGAVVVGPAANVADGVALAKAEAIDAAVVDINLNGELSDPVAAALQERDIPFVFATGYGDTGQEGMGEARIVDKPYTQETLVAALTAVLEAG